MTKQEQWALIHLIANRENPSIPMCTYEYESARDKLKRKELYSISEIVRLTKSEDFKLGWQLCHESFKQILTNIMTMSPAELKRYAGKMPVKKKT